MIQEISYKVLQKLNGCKWMYDSTIKGCIDAVDHQQNLSLTDTQRDEIFKKVREVLNTLQNMEKINDNRRS